MPSQLKALASSIERLQTQEPSTRERLQRRQQPTAPQFNLGAVAIVLVAQTVLVAFSVRAEVYAIAKSYTCH